MKCLSINHKSIGFLLLWSIINSCIAQQTSIWYPDQQPFVHFYNESEISSEAAYSIKQDSHGYFWIGSDDLLRYDGYSVQRYPHPIHEEFGFIIKSLLLVFLDSEDRVWTRYAGRFFIFDPETEKYTESSSVWPFHFSEVEKGSIWATTANGLVNYSFPPDSSKPEVWIIYNRAYPTKLFPFIDSLKLTNTPILALGKNEFDGSSYNFSVSDSSAFLMVSVHGHGQSFSISQEKQKIWHKDSLFNSSTKSFPTLPLSYGKVSLSKGTYTLHSHSQRQNSSPDFEHPFLEVPEEGKYAGMYLIPMDTIQRQYFDSIELDFQENMYRVSPPATNRHRIHHVEDSLYWLSNANFFDGFQKIVLKDKSIWSQERVLDTIYHSGKIKKWLTEHTLPLDDRFVLLIGGGHAFYRLGGMTYPMAILDTETEKLIEIRHNLADFPQFENPGYGYIIYQTYQDEYGDIWIGTSSHGQLKFRLPKNWQNEQEISIQLESVKLVDDTKTLLRTNTFIFDIHPDSYGNLWVGSLKDGISKIDIEQRSIKKPPYPKWLSIEKFHPEVIEWGNTFWTDREDKTWLIQYPDILGWYDNTNNTFHKVSNFNANLSDALRGIIFEDSRDHLWALSKRESLARIHKNTYKVDLFPFPEGCPINRVFEDGKGKIWAIDMCSNFYQVDEQKKVFNPVNLFSDESSVKKWDGAFTAKSDLQGNSWITFHAGGLGKLSYTTSSQGKDSLVFKEYIPDQRCIALHIEKDLLYIGSPDGLMIFDPEKEEVIEKLNHESGFDGRWVMFIWVDKQKRIWFSDEYTFSFYDPQLKRTFTPKELSYLTNFDPPTVSKNGILSIGVKDGLIRVNTNTYQVDQSPPKINLEKLVSRGKEKETSFNLLSKNPKESYRIPFALNSLEIQYTGIHYDDPLKNRFQYQLVGVDDDWVDAGLERTARYPNLPAGTYTFQVKAANANGFWSEPTSVTFPVLPPWWRTWWAYTLYILAIAGLVYAFYRFQLNRQLAEAEANKFREIDEVKSRLYTNITHEFRTPLTIINGLTDQIKGFDKLRHIIKRNTGQLLNLVNQLLDLAKMEEGKLAIDYIQADVIPFIHSVSDTFNNVAEAKNILLTVRTEPRELHMDFDKEKLQHILTNLLSNALKFTPEGGKVELLTTRTEENLFKIQVKDSGIGISKEKLPHIFNRFYQGDQSDTRKWEGTGIGLALVKELTQLLDGQIEVVSNEDTGSTFSVKLPIMNEAPLTEITTLAPAFTIGNSPVVQKENFILSLEPQAPRALIVEDNEDVIFYLKSQLSKAYQLIVARNGREGIERAVNLIPDIIISDIMMPEVDGLELCQTLKNNPHTSHIPIILLTAKGDLDSKISGLSKGADAYLPKPFNQRELETRLEQLIASRKKMQQQFSTGKWGEIDFPQNPQLRQEYEFLKKVTDFIKANLSDEDLSIPKIASAVNMERSQLYRKINQLTGHSPSHLLKQLRLQKAHELLVHSNMNVSEIAFECGFKELPSLSRNYKAYFGKTPTEERKERKPKV